MTIVQRSPDSDGVWREKLLAFEGGSARPLDGLPTPIGAWWAGWQLRTAYAAAALGCINEDGSPSVSPGFGTTGQTLAAPIIAAGAAQSQLASVVYDQSGNARDVSALAAVAPQLYDFATQTIVHENLSQALAYPIATPRSLTRGDALGLSGDPALTIAWKGRCASLPDNSGPNVLALGSALVPELCLYANPTLGADIVALTDFAATIGGSWSFPNGTIVGLHSYVLTKPAGTGYDATTWVLYLDGVQVPTFALGAGPLAIANEATQLGDVPGGGFPYAGTLEGVIVWDVVLSLLELAQLQAFLDSV